MSDTNANEPTPVVKDSQSITADGQSVRPLIDGVTIRRAPPIEDERGDLCEVYDPAWRIDDGPLVYVYQVTLRPGKVRGWAMHRKQDDRIFVSRGVLRFAFYDDRPASSTYKLLNVFTVSDRNRSLVVIPRGVFHAIQNIGETEATFLNLPTAPYDRADPDKYRLPHGNDVIPFSFDEPIGW
jgi:dTDP-4-dehydrorhamnose 3,5-epimerase